MQDVLDKIAQVLYEKKAANILVLDLQAISSLTHFIIIAEGSVDRHVIGLAKHLIAELAEEGQEPLYTEGLRDGEWVALDYGNFIVHLMTPEYREKYALEELWRDAKIVDIIIQLESKR